MSHALLLCSQAAYLALTQLLDYKHELVLLLVNTLLSDLKSDNFVVVASALVVTSKLIGPDLINAGACGFALFCFGSCLYPSAAVLSTMCILQLGPCCLVSCGI
jgi:hypothetical protein